VDTEIRTPAFCTQCRSRCGCLAVVRDRRLVAVEPLSGHPSGAKLCPKGKAAPELVHHPERLTRPLRRTAPKTASDPGWRPISWDQALREIAERMCAIRDRHGAEQVAFSVTTPSGTHISDSISWIERLIRAYGSPNTIYGTEICNWHKDFATRLTFGHDIGTPDFAHTDCVLLWGNNPATTWLARAGEISKATKRGARMIVVDPRPTVHARRADCWLRVAPGTDQALALGLAHLLIESGRIDHRFLAEWTNGPFLVRSDTGRFLREADVAAGGRPDVLFGCRAEGGELLRYDAARGAWLDDIGGMALRATAEVAAPDGPSACRSAFDLYAAAAAAYPPGRVARDTGVPAAVLREAADILAGSPSIAYYAWNGVGQSVTATQTDRAIALLYALTGGYGRAGGNVPGGAAPFADISGGDLLSPGQRAKALGSSGRPMGPALSGWVTARDVYRAVLEHDPYPVRMLVSFGTNLLASQPDTERAKSALEALEFHVHADFFLNPSARHADIVLPVATSWEREGLRPGFDVGLEGLRRVQLRPAVVPPVGEARSDTDIVLALARMLGFEDRFFGCDADRGHDHVLAPAGLSVQRLRAAPDGIELAATVPLQAYAARRDDGAPVGFPTPTRKVEIYSERLAESGYAPVPSLDPNELPRRNAEFPLRLGCAKTVAYCHSQHRNIASLRRLMPDPVVEMSPEVAEARGIARGDWVRITTQLGSVVARAKLVPDLAPDAVFAQHGWWVEGPDDTNLNRVIDTRRADPISGSLPMRCSWCHIAKLTAG
jgi:anaerobic selenocysteine-containing dehydrogenase